MSRQIFSGTYIGEVVALRQRMLSFLVAATLFFQCAVAREPAKPQKEVWAENRIDNVRAGYYHESETRDRNAQIVTSITNDIVLNRMGSKVEVKSMSRYEESTDGRLLAVNNEMSSSAQSTTTDATVQGNALV